MDPDDSILYKTEFPLPERQNNYETAFREATDRLKARDIRDVTDRSGAIVIASPQGSALLLPFIGEELVITHPDITVTNASGAGEVPMWEKILALHYLERATGAAPRGEQVAFKQLEGGLAYDTAFQRRTVDLLIKRFGPGLDGMAAAGAAAGGKRSDLGEHALSFRAFPRVEVVFVLWMGDEEFPPSGSVIFDASIADYLSTEDVAVLCNMIAVRIMKAAGAA
ncbi:MAG TPA: DUF3786 domain-containing protein [Spirochaetota bacterium]|nr:DUF3786 domain-containing protein [Spirochaetota bacterium]HOD14468.1 DUF3786 domain-containing protein [Spirochaetota bacterium]HPN14058.1 DUF3786 domain-containing protein [Spirochaetota bacterium]